MNWGRKRVLENLLKMFLQKEEGSEEIQEDDVAVESDKNNEEEIVLETDDSEDLEVSENLKTSTELEAEILKYQKNQNQMQLAILMSK